MARCLWLYECTRKYNDAVGYANALKSTTRSFFVLGLLDVTHFRNTFKFALNHADTYSTLGTFLVNACYSQMDVILTEHILSCHDCLLCIYANTHVSNWTSPEILVSISFKCTVQCLYNAVQYKKLLHISLQWRGQNINQILNLQKTHHTSPWRVSYGVSSTRVVDKIDRVITAPHCN